ncbi:MAG TPA: CDP-diacylglycerol diphosphatase [Acetobacteraceae bacterium]|nr:CDP-diacylglycerol diphosphatase [Acetobacteraceae bacterium]
MVKSGVGVTTLLLALLAHPCSAADPNALWQIVGGQCVPDEQQNHSPKPCAQVDLAGGYAVLKDIVGDTQFLLIPTTRVSGIESPEVLAPGAPNYWQAAWEARRYVDERARRDLPRDDVSLAINAEGSRTQNQLHIHVDCVRLDVQATLREYASAIGTSWAAFPVELAGHNYMAMRIEQPDLTHANPFLLLADGIPGARADMGGYTLVVVGQPGGFVVLAGHGSGEALQDHGCAAAH